MMDERILILGGGAAGLTAARELSNRGANVTLIEARDRLGGRIHTVHESDWPAPLEMGAEFVHGKPPETWDLIHAGKLVAYEVPDEHVELTPRGTLKPMDDFFETIEPILSKLEKVRRDRDITFAEFLKTYIRPKSAKQREAAQLAKSYVQGFNAADATKISSIALREAEADEEKIEGDKLFRIVDGYDALIAFLARGLDPKRIDVRLNTIVTEVRWKRGSVELLAVTPTGERLAPIYGTQLLVTLPLGVLKAKRGERGYVRFSPEIADKREAIRTLEMGPVVKAICRLRPAFFEEHLSEHTFLHGDRLPFQTWWTMRALHVPMLIGWAGGPAAAKLSGRGDDRIIRAAIDSLAKLLNVTKKRIRTELEAIRICDWQVDPFARGAYSYVAVGGLDSMKTLAAPVDDTLFFAGEATHWEGMSGTVAGAIASGLRVADEIRA